MSDIVFIGIGKMGLPMAAHLRAAGHAVRAFDRDATRLELAAGRGLDTLGSASALDAALARAPQVVSSLPDDAALIAVARQLAAAGRAGATWIDTSTVSAAASAEAAHTAAAAGMACLRATVSGNATMAERAQLTVYASGPRSAWDAHETLFDAWGRQRFYLGAGEEARIAKLAVNLLIVGTSTMLAEALALGERGGLDWATLWQLFEASAAASPILRAKAPALQAHDYTPTFTVEQMRKDVALIRGAARALGVATPVADIAEAALRRASDAGHGGDDYAVVIRTARDASTR